MGKKSQSAVAVSKVQSLMDEIAELKKVITNLYSKLETKEVSIEDLCLTYHNDATKELVVNNAKNLITKPQDQKPFVEWKNLTEDMKEGRRILMKVLQKYYKIFPR